MNEGLTVLEERNRAVEEEGESACRNCHSDHLQDPKERKQGTVYRRGRCKILPTHGGNKDLPQEAQNEFSKVPQRIAASQPIGFVEVIHGTLQIEGGLQTLF